MAPHACLDKVVKIDDRHRSCALGEDELATCDTSNRKLPDARLCQECFLKLRALTLDRFKAAHIKDSSWRRNKTTTITTWQYTART